MGGGGVYLRGSGGAYNRMHFLSTGGWAYKWGRGGGAYKGGG